MTKIEKFNFFVLILWVLGTLATSPLFFHPENYLNSGEKVLQIIPFTFFALITAVFFLSIIFRKKRISDLISYLTVISLATSFLFSMVDRHYLSKRPTFLYTNLTINNTELIATESIFHYFNKIANTLNTDTPQASYLLVGDSYTVGTGSLPECNYPDVLATSVKELGGAQTDVINLGVSGTGPVNYSAIINATRSLAGSDSFFIINIFLGNDITDNLNGTYRRVVAGNFIHRFPDNLISDWLNPINWHITRLLMNLEKIIGNLNVLDTHNNRRIACKFDPTPISHHHASWYQKRIKLVNKMKNNLPEFQLNLERLKSNLSAPSRFLIVLFPDRLQADTKLREEMDPHILQEYLHVLDQAKQIVINTFGRENVLDLDNRFSEQHYGVDATHLNDTGNKEAARIVAEHLAEYF